MRLDTQTTLTLPLRGKPRGRRRRTSPAVWLLLRLAQAVVVLAGVSLITFGLVWLAPGDPAQAMFTSQGITPTPEMVAQLRGQLGLDLPFWEQYAQWLSNCLRGDFGESYSLSQPVTQLIQQRLGPTLQLAGAAMVLMLAFSLPLGIWAAIRPNSVVDYAVRGFSFLGISMPNFWFGLLLLYFFALQLRWVPVVSVNNTPQQLILPAVTLAFAMTGKYTRQVRAAMLEELGQDYVIGARARGLTESTILLRHVFPNALLPLVTLFGLSLGSLLGGTAVVEVIFSFQGLGNMAVGAVTTFDYPLVQAYVLWIAIIYLGINMLVDASYALLDPRIRKGARG